jgi:hypothetical protein
VACAINTWLLSKSSKAQRDLLKAMVGFLGKLAESGNNDN